MVTRGSVCGRHEYRDQDQGHQCCCLARLHGVWFQDRRVIKDVSDLSGLSYVPTILFWKDTVFAKEMADLRPVSLFT